MKLLRAEFQNFRLLRDLELTFAGDPDKHLTVIRAANESGKTTILLALQWALYGDDALPGKGDGFRLYPIDWNGDDGKRVPITATVEFELTSYRRISGNEQETRRRYRLVRSAFEEVDNQARRPTSTIRLFALTDTGASPIDAPEALINDELPPELREVFFTDGDRALSFIEADVALSTKRNRVQRAIRSLLGLGILDDAIKHVRRSAAEVNKKAKQVGTGGELNEIASRLEAIDDDLTKWETDLEDAREQSAAFDGKVNETDRKIAAALQKGDKEKLQKDLESAGREIKRLDEQLTAAIKEHSALFRGRAIALDLLSPLVGRAYEKLEELHDQGKIPNMAIPVLQERLSAEMCICGEVLAPEDPAGEKRRKHIRKLIDDSQRADELQEVVTDLYYGAKSLRNSGEIEASGWLEDYRKVVERRDGIQTLRDEAGRKLRALEQQLASLSDTDIQGLRETRGQYKGQYDRCLSKRSTLETQIENLQRERDELTDKRDRLLREQKKGARILAESEVTQDVMKVLQSAYERITNEELGKVSNLMNSIFLEMIGADPEQGAIIRRAEISPEFDIIVYGPNDRTLNPDRDLNGASRRALTLAFILALTKVSEVEAPNVIDTPLGMTSGFVKRSILRTAVRESTQLVLFLTHDEIAGCEEIIDEAAGEVFTLTNPAHYPKMLINDPNIPERKVLRCECDHRRECELCQRRADVTIEPDMAL
ncbi:AAA family ATPase [Candidatus Thiosymbion oneisti]|uniref:AAA family ATPase n=1 Tax=Candidatus Thiosymbion oneisti TaxID=589554 RepID=UPI000A6D8491|nr:AAA family ATPase [Candidatus Thiosymbion oneisti]